MYKKLIKLICAVSTTVLVTLAPGVVSASGFALIEQSVSGMGNAYAGGAAIAEDASTIFFNPAGMSRLSSSELVGALHYIRPSSKFKDGGSNMSPLGVLTGGDGGEAGEAAIVPNAYYVQKIGQSMAFGLGINSPFGLSTEYDPGWKGRYHGIKSSVITININPSFSFKANDKLSLGVGLNIQYLDAELTNALDMGFLIGGAGAAQTGDVEAAVTGDSLGYGFNLGVLFEISDSIRLGAAYRSKIDHTLKGDLKYTNTSGAVFLGLAQAGGSFTNTSAEADITLPESLSVSAYFDLSSKLALMADITWTKWSQLDELLIKFGTTTPSSSVESFNWDDTLRYSVGLNFKASDATVLRAGLAFDETPIKNATERSVRVPGNDRTWISLGAGFKVADNANIDVGYAHLIVDDAAINRSDTNPVIQHNLVGSYEASVDILSVQGTWRF